MSSCELMLVLPAYDEQEVIAQTLAEWREVLDRLEIDFEIHLYDDGSRDETAALALAAAAVEPRLVVHRQSNRGHGPTLLRGYREAMAAAVPWIAQADGDAEIPPLEFAELWARRAEFDLLVGRRRGHRPRSRALISSAARTSVRMLFGGGIHDVNSPFRLWRTAALAPLVETLSPSLFAPNVVLSGLAARRRLRRLEISVAFRPRNSSLVGRRLLLGTLLALAQTLGVAVCSRPQRR
jgi:glycosyltransferase involved in cell wall biosynthesis